MKVLALDLGSKRIGVAVSDELGITAQGFSVIERVDDQRLVESIREIVLKEGVQEVVVGLPLNMNGSVGPQAKSAMNFADKLKEKLNIVVKLWDERMTTMEVERLMIEANTSRNKRRKKADKVAAQLILQGYLNSIKRTNL